MIKTSSVANFIKKLFGINDDRNNLSIEEIIALDYYECISYLYNGKEMPIVYGYRDGVNIWLKTSVGPIELDSIPHGNGHLTNNVYELEALIADNGYDESYVVDLINKILKEKYNK
ncbi:MAG: hypothetical protein ACI35S_06965 [Anaeroplasma sp.]